MNTFDSVTLRAFLVALYKLEGDLPSAEWFRIREVGMNLEQALPELHRIALDSGCLELHYRHARLALQEDVTSRFRVVSFGEKYLDEKNRLFTFAEAVLTSRNPLDVLRCEASINDEFKRVLDKVESYPYSAQSLSEATIPEEHQETEFDDAMNAFMATFDEWSDVYQRLANS
jgi:hypothetical protein